ncbi:hypothetical protein OXX80_002397 [Metschnikowia pulcherrima]
MDLSGSSVYSVIRTGTPEQAHTVLQELKKHVKKDNVHLPWVGKYFEALSVASDSSEAAINTLAFSLVCHLVKRVSIQDVSGTVLSEQSFLVLPMLIPRIADAKTSVKVSAKRALEAYWLSSPKSVEVAIVDLGLSRRSSLLVNECVAWLNYILTSVSPHFKLDTFLDPLARVLCEHAEDEKLVSNVKVLLENYYELKQNRIRKFDLQKALERNNVPAALRISIMGTDSIMSRPESTFTQTQSVTTKPLSQAHSPEKPSSNRPVDSSNKMASQDDSHLSEGPGLSSNAELRAFLGKLKGYAYDFSFEPANVTDANELNQVFSSMYVSFEEKETERNWGAREKGILKMRGLIRGNAAAEYLSDLMTNIREVHEGICKSLSSLRTTLSVNSCQLVKEMAFLLREAFEPLADLFIPTLTRLCSNTKHLTNYNSHLAMCAILAQCPITTKLASKISSAASEKSVNTKNFACSWLQIYIIRSHDQWRGAGSEIVDKALLKLLPDPNMQVRQAAKDAYWKYCEHAEQSAINLRSQLDTNINRALERSRPKGIFIPTPPALAAPKTRPSLKESIMAKKKELMTKQGGSRPPSRNGSSHLSGPGNEKFVTSSLPSKYQRTPSFESQSQTRPHLPSPSIQKHDSKALFDRFLDIDSKKPSKSVHSSPEGCTRKYARPHIMPNSAAEPHYASSTFSHPSSKMSQARSPAYLKGDHNSERSSSELKTTIPPETNYHQSRAHLGVEVEHESADLAGDDNKQRIRDAHSWPKNKRETFEVDPQPRDTTYASEDILHKLLTSSDEQVVKEGVHLLREAIVNGEPVAEDLVPTLKKITVTNPLLLSPLFEMSEPLLRKSFKVFTNEDFLRVCCILMPPSQGAFEVLISLYTSDQLYSSVETMLSYVLELTDIVDDGLLIMQLIKYKDRILTMILRVLAHSTSKIAISDVAFTKLTGDLFDLVPVVHQTKLTEDYKTVLCKLHAINSKLFVYQLSSIATPSKQEIEHLVGIDDTLDFKNMESTNFNLTDFTRVSPSKDLEHLSPLKFPSEFTMLLPANKVKLEANATNTGYDADFQGSPSRNKAASEEEKDDRICLEQPPQMEFVREEDVIMDDVIENQGGLTESPLKYDDMSDSIRQEAKEEPGAREGHPTDMKLEVHDFDILQQPETKNFAEGSSHRENSNELAEDFASVRLTSQPNSIETFIERVDPLSKLSSRNRPISIFDDAKAGSPQKVREYDFTELNWFNFLMAKMSLDYGVDDLERYSMHNFRSLCEQLSNGSVSEISLATMMKFLRSPDPESLTSFLRSEGFGLVENAAMDYLSHEHSNLMGGLMIIKQLLVHRHAVDITRLWPMLVDLSRLECKDPLRTLDLAIGETFNEALCGLYPSKELLQIVLCTFQNEQSPNDGASKFCLECLYKLVCTDTLVLSIDEGLVIGVDQAIRPFASHKRADIRKIAVEIYGRTYRAAKISEMSRDAEMLSTYGSSSHEAMKQVLSSLTVPQQRIIEYFSQVR